MPAERCSVDGCSYGCVFCRTGQECRTAQSVEAMWPGVRARAVSALKRRSRNGVRTLQPEIIIPGYVFFEAPSGFQPVPPTPDGVLRILTDLDGRWMLTGSDEEFARWLLSHDGEIGLSQAHYVGERITIRQGPLKDFEGAILRIDRRNRNGLVQLEVDGRRILVWLPFEIAEPEDLGYTDITR